TKENVKSFEKKLPIRYIYQKNAGPASARNLGIQKAEGEIIAFTDDDCRPAKDWLENILKAFQKRSLPSGLENMKQGKDKRVDKGRIDGVEGLTRPEGTVGPFTQYILNKEGGGYPTCNLAFRKDVIRQGFDTSYPYPFREDTDLAFQVLSKGGNIVFSRSAVVVHPAEKISFWKALKKKKYFISDMLLFKKFPKLYKERIRMPFELFTAFYIVLSVLSFFSLYFVIGFVLVGLTELFYRKWHVGFIGFFKFLLLQLVGSYVILISDIMGIVKYRVNLFRLIL
ncbi:glycosyltransferase, partial [Candidatus Woesearchaeota archaeon]|nr:glycosyltransferase [Candidatus Woesearchaeota archaeon]